MIKMKARRQFASVLWGNVDVGDIFEVAEGYVADLEKQGVAIRHEDDAKRAAIESLRTPRRRRS